MNTFQIPVSKLSRNQFPICMNCQNCRQYLPLDGRSPSIYCQKPPRGEGYWPIEDESTCSKHKARNVPADAIAMEDAQFRALLLDLMSTIACTLINETVSPQAVGAFKRFKDASQPLLEGDLPELSTINLVPVVGHTRTVVLLNEALSYLDALKEGDFITEEIHSTLKSIHDRVDVLWTA